MNRLSYVSDHHIKNKNDITGLNIYTLFPCSGVRRTSLQRLDKYYRNIISGGVSLNRQYHSAEKKK